MISKFIPVVIAFIAGCVVTILAVMIKAHVTARVEPAIESYDRAYQINRKVEHNWVPIEVDGVILYKRQ